MNDIKQLKEALPYLAILSKKMVERGSLVNFWERIKALDAEKLSKNLYDVEIVRLLKRKLKKKTNINFSEDQIMDSIHKIITTKIISEKPKVCNGSKK